MTQRRIFKYPLDHRRLGEWQDVALQGGNDAFPLSVGVDANGTVCLWANCVPDQEKGVWRVWLDITGGSPPDIGAAVFLGTVMHPARGLVYHCWVYRP